MKKIMASDSLISVLMDTKSFLYVFTNTYLLETNRGWEKKKMAT